MPVYWSRCGVLRARCADLFDGRLIDRPAVRSLDDLEGAAREARERGFKAIKTNLLLFDDKGGRMFAPGMTGAGAGHPELNLGDDILDALIAQLCALREGAGPGVRLLVDLNFNYKPEGLRRIAKAVEPFNLLWLEMDLHEPKALSLVRQSTTTPIGSLETILGRRSLKPYLESHAVDVAIIDAQWNGLTEVGQDGGHGRRLRGQRRLAQFQRSARQHHERPFLRRDPQFPHHGVRCRRGAVEGEADHQPVRDRERRDAASRRGGLGHGGERGDGARASRKA